MDENTVLAFVKMTNHRKSGENDHLLPHRRWQPMPLRPALLSPSHLAALPLPNRVPRQPFYYPLRRQPRRQRREQSPILCESICAFSALGQHHRYPHRCHPRSRHPHRRFRHHPNRLQSQCLMP